MTAEEHLALRAKYNPDGSPVREYQLKLLEILKFFDAFCREHGLKYGLDSGTCLGAVRHKGFIPWDDDIDVYMMREEYEKFEKLFKDTDKFALCTRDNDLFYTVGMPKVRLKGMDVKERDTNSDINYEYKGPWLDIFVIDKATKLSAQHFKARSYWLHVFTKRPNPGPVCKALLKFFKGFYMWEIKVWEPIDRRLPWAKIRHRLGDPFYKETFPEGLLDNTAEVEFEGGMYPAPADWDTYLKIYFPTYMTVPSEEQIEAARHF